MRERPLCGLLSLSHSVALCHAVPQVGKEQHLALYLNISRLTCAQSGSLIISHSATLAQLLELH